MTFYEFGVAACGDASLAFLGLFDFSIAPTLLFYSYIPIVIASLLIGGYVYANNKHLTQARLLFLVTVLFVLWVINILLQWIAAPADLVMFAWQLTAILEVGLYLSAFYFAYAFFYRGATPFSLKLLLAAVVAVVAILTPTILNIASFDFYNCEGTVGPLWSVIYALEPAVIVLVALTGFHAYRKADDVSHRKQIAILATAVALFLSVFFASNYYGELTQAYEFNLWGPLGMFAFILLVGYMIVQFRAFNVKLLAAQALVTATVLLIASEYFFVENNVSRFLVTATLLLSIVFGYLLVRSVKREVQQREHIERLAKDLEKANQQQVILIHFITHQIKGFVTKSRNIFSMLLEGDFGPVPDSMKPMIEEGFQSDTKGANTIQEILNAANIRSGKVTYTKSPIDLRELTDGIMKDLKPAADSKGLALTFDAGDQDYTIQGDRMQLTNAVKNLIDNSIKYTPQGSVAVSLARAENKVRLTIADTGVGISSEDMKLLFTEGGHGKDSTKVNVDSTGFGLYIVKNIVEAHHGRVWAESEGAGKGSRFILEIPVS